MYRTVYRIVALVSRYTSYQKMYCWSPIWPWNPHYSKLVQSTVDVIQDGDHGSLSILNFEIRAKIRRIIYGITVSFT